MATAALDLGRRRIGVAVTDAASLGAHPIGVVERRSIKHDLEALGAILRDREVSTIVVGLPINMDGSEGPAARAARTFAGRIAEALGVTVEMFDERLTSFEAEERLKGMPIKKGARKPAIDAIAAAVILEGWMQSQAQKTSRANDRSKT